MDDANLGITLSLPKLIGLGFRNRDYSWEKGKLPQERFGTPSPGIAEHGGKTTVTSKQVTSSRQRDFSS